MMMTERSYQISVVQDGQELYSGFGLGDNAYAAFENAVDQGALYVPPGFIGYAVVIRQDNGLAFKFEVGFATK